MALITSISGIRGTLGGVAGSGLTPVDVVKFVAAFGVWLKDRGEAKKKVIMGRDARPSGRSISWLVGATLQNLGIEVVDLGLATTPTVEIATPAERADGGIVVTASHNPVEWNALKLLNHAGEPLSVSDGKAVLQYAKKGEFNFAPAGAFGQYRQIEAYADRHIALVTAYPLVDVEAIQKAAFSIVVDAVNSVGGIVVPNLLKALGVRSVKKIYCHPNGLFPHNPEPLPEHLGAIRKEMKNASYDLGIAVDPDVDRLALIQEDGIPFGEEYTLVAVTDYVLSSRPGNVVANLSSTRALQDIVNKAGCSYYASAVGEVNVVEKMKSVNAVVGGEGNGGVIVPDFHYGRDALIGIALFLTHLARVKEKASVLKKRYPLYHILKNKILLNHKTDTDRILARVQEKYRGEDISTLDGVKINFNKNKEWIHLRQSNTEPIIRVYAESSSEIGANRLFEKVMSDIKSII